MARSEHDDTAAMAASPVPDTRLDMRMTPVESETLVSSVWQDPFVEVLKFGMNHRHIGWCSQGDVEQKLDKQIHKNVFRIRGKIAATNFLRVPRDVSKIAQGLGLTGRYVYIQVCGAAYHWSLLYLPNILGGEQLRRVQDMPITLHLDIMTSKKTTLRFTLSSIYGNVRSTGTVLRVPLVLSDQWTTMMLDMARLLEYHTFNSYCREQYRNLKAVTLCTAMNVRNVFTSTHAYDYESLPSTLRFPDKHVKSTTGTTWEAQYAWLELPPRPSVHRSQQPAIAMDNQQTHDWPSPQRRDQRSLDNVIDSPPTSSSRQTAIHPAQKTQKVAESRAVPREVYMRASPKTREALLQRDRNAVLSKADQILRVAGVEDVIGYEHTSLQTPGSPVSPKSPRSAQRGRPRRPHASVTSTTWPDPILSLRRIIGLSNDFPNSLMWIPGTSACVYACFNTIVILEFLRAPQDESQPAALSSSAAPASVNASKGSWCDLGRTKQHFLTAHLGVIAGLAISPDGLLLASVEKSPSVLRVWDFTTHECTTVIKGPAKGIHTLSFSADAKQLCAAGLDDMRRTQLSVWDCSAVLDGKVVLLAKQLSDFDVTRVLFCPYEADQLISCGRENVRYWRIKRQHLPGSPVILNEYARGTVFTDMAFDQLYQAFPTNIPRMRPVHVASSAGTVVTIDYDSKDVVCVYKLHDGPIHSLSMNEGFCVTGSADRFLRVWPLDFTDFFLEAQHEAGLTSVDVSADGMQVLVGSNNGAIGVLDISDQRYETVLRAHTHEITAMAVISDDEFVTAAMDGTLRVWDFASGFQTYEFDMTRDTVTCLCAVPTTASHVAIGFQSGCIRVFDVHRSSHGVVCEFQQHQSALRHLAYTRNGAVLYSSGAGQQLCKHDSARNYAPVKMLVVDFDANDGHFSLSRDRKWLATISSDRQRVLLLDSVTLRPAATLQPGGAHRDTNSKTAAAATSRLLQLRINHNSSELMVLSSSFRMFVYSLTTQTLLHSMVLLGQEGIRTFAVSPNEKYLATGGGDGSLRIWKWESRQHCSRMHQSFLGQTGKVSLVAFANDGKYVVASGSAGTVFVWDFLADPLPLPDNSDNQSDDHDGDGDDDADCDTVALQDDALDDGADPDGVSRRKERKSLQLQLDDDAFILSTESENVALDDDPALMGIAMEELHPRTDCQAVLKVKHAVLGLDPRLVVWAYAIGCLVYPVGRVLVVEDLEAGTQTFHSDFNAVPIANQCDDNISSSAAISLLKLSCDQHFAVTAVTGCEFVSVRQLVCEGNQREAPVEAVRLALPVDTVTVIDAAFTLTGATDTARLCLLCVLIDGQRTLRTSSLDDIHATAKDLALDHASCYLSYLPSTDSLLTFELTTTQQSALRVWKTPKLSMEATAASSSSCPLPTTITLVRPRVGTTQVVAMDADAFVFFFCVRSHSMLATSRLLMVPTRPHFDLVDWVGDQHDHQLIVSSRSGSVTVYVHTLPMQSTRARARVDWKLAGRGGLSLLTTVALPALTPIATLSVDPWRTVGVVSTTTGDVIVLDFRHGTKRYLKKTGETTTSTTTAATSSTSSLVNPTAGACVDAVWSLQDQVILAQSPLHRSVITYWTPLASSRALGCLGVRGAACTCITVNTAFAGGVHGKSIVVTGYDDGSVRLFDVASMKLLGQCSLALRSSTTKTAINSDAALQQLVIAGTFAVVAVTRDHRIMLLDVSMPVRGHYGLTSATAATKFARKDQALEIVYRELTSPQHQQRGTQTLAVHSVDVQMSGDDERAVHPFVVVTQTSSTTASDAMNAATATVAQVFAHPKMLSFEDNVHATDTWALRLPWQHALVSFVPHTTHAVYATAELPLSPARAVPHSCWLEERDFLAQQVLRRIHLRGVDMPVSMGAVPVADEDEHGVLVCDRAGRAVLLLDRATAVVEMDTATARAMQVTPHVRPQGNNKGAVLLVNNNNGRSQLDTRQASKLIVGQLALRRSGQ